MRGRALAAVLCLAPLGAGAGAAAAPGPVNAAISVTIDPTTSWQPRGGQVRFMLEGGAEPLRSLNVSASFRWTGREDGIAAAVQVVEFTGTRAVLAATVPDALDAMPTSWLARLLGPTTLPGAAAPVQFDALGAVPLAELRITAGAAASDPAVEVVRTVGITSVWAARLIAAAALAAALALLLASAAARGVPGRFLMRLISTRRGYASLSQFQVMLWTLLFGAGAVYCPESEVRPSTGSGLCGSLSLFAGGVTWARVRSALN